jgi:hypothetical protein
MKRSEAKQKIQGMVNQQEVDSFASNASRARSITVGTAFGGTTEIGMRGDGGQSLWCLMQPVEVIELIHQLAANVGCHINLQPRRDFSSWRDWKYTEDELAYARGQQAASGIGHVPHVNDMAPHQSKGQALPPPEQQPGLKLNRSDKNVVATEESGNRRIAKRTARKPA